MNIEQKLAYIRKALELGAHVELNFHNYKEEEEAEKVAMELSQLTNTPYTKKQNGSTRWFKLQRWDDEFESAIFYKDDEKFMEEDVDLTGGEKHVS